MDEALQISVYAKLKKLGKTQKWLSEQLDISEQYLSDILKGRRQPQKYITDICNLLDITIKDV